MRSNRRSRIQAVEWKHRVSRSDIHAIARPHFKVQMRRIIPIRRAHSPDLPTPRNEGANENIDPAEVRIHRVQHLAVQRPMPHHQQIPPTRRWLTRVENPPIRRGIHRISQIRIHPTDPIQIIARVMPAALFIHFPKFLRIIHHAPVLRAHRRIEAPCQRDLHRLPSREKMEAMIRK